LGRSVGESRKVVASPNPIAWRELRPVDRRSQIQRKYRGNFIVRLRFAGIEIGPPSWVEAYSYWFQFLGRREPKVLHDEIFDWHWGDLVAPMPENSEGGCNLQPPFFVRRFLKLLQQTPQLTDLPFMIGKQ
jgi:hypothetical protein